MGGQTATTKKKQQVNVQLDVCLHTIVEILFIVCY